MLIEMPPIETPPIKTPPIGAPAQPIQPVDAHTLKQWFDRGSVLLVDVREPGEYAGAHIPGAVLMPLSTFDPDQLPTDAHKIRVLYCRTGNRSEHAAQRLIDVGIEPVLHLAGGIEDWQHRDYPVYVRARAPISLMRQVQMIVGSLVLLGTMLGVLVSPWFLLLSGLVGAGLLYAGLSGNCMMALLLTRLPYNQRL